MYTVSSSPHIKSNDSVQGIMRDVIIALIPATFAGNHCGSGRDDRSRNRSSRRRRRDP